MNQILRILTYVVLLGSIFASVSSCKKDDDPGSTSFGTISGVVMDNANHPLADVTVTVSGVSESDVVVTTGSDGKYTAENISIKLHAVTFSKKDWLTVSKSAQATDFDANKIATVNISMTGASAKISGTISDAKNGNAPLDDVTITIGVAGTTTSASDGTYKIENLVEAAYTVTFTKENYITVTKPVSMTDFVNGLVTLNVTMGGNELLRDLTADNLATASKWYYNEYRGGRNADAYPHWDWACDYMASLTFHGQWEEQNEGTTLQVRNAADQQGNPADLNVFDSYVYGSKLITADNKIMTVRLRTHNADVAAPMYYGVQVIDLSAAEPTNVKIADKTYASEDYADVDFDLSNYVGKEVIIAIGIYRQSTGDYWKQLVLRAIRFADKKVEGTNWLPGTDVVEGWKLSQETARSTMPQTKKHFTGISQVTGNRDSYVDAYRAWPGINHIAAEWSFVPLKKDPEVFAGEGYLIKTRNTPEVSTVVPEAYMYAKFSIASGSDHLTLRTRNFSATPTYFKLTAIENDGTVTHIAATTNTAQSASAAADGCWKFSHQDGGAGNPEGYASFVYDLSQFDGKDVTLVYGVYNGEANSGENKLVFYSIDLN